MSAEFESRVWELAQKWIYDEGGRWPQAMCVTFLVPRVRSSTDLLPLAPLGSDQSDDVHLLWVGFSRPCRCRHCSLHLLSEGVVPHTCLGCWTGGEGALPTLGISGTGQDKAHHFSCLYSASHSSFECLKPLGSYSSTATSAHSTGQEGMKQRSLCHSAVLYICWRVPLSCNRVGL